VIVSSSRDQGHPADEMLNVVTSIWLWLYAFYAWWFYFP
jgi:hypothetical protein